MIRIEGQTDIDEQISAQLLHRSRDKGAKRLRIMVWGLILVILGLYGARTLENPRYAWMFAIVLIAPVVMLLHRYVLWPRRMRNIFEENVSPPLSLEMTSEGMKNEGDEAPLPWSSFVKWMENDALLLLYHSASTFQAVPKRLLDDDDLAQVRGWLRAQLGPAS